MTILYRYFKRFYVKRAQALSFHKFIARPSTKWYTPPVTVTVTAVVVDAFNTQHDWPLSISNAIKPSYQIKMTGKKNIIKKSFYSLNLLYLFIVAHSDILIDVKVWASCVFYVLIIADFAATALNQQIFQFVKYFYTFNVWCERHRNILLLTRRSARKQGSAVFD